MTQECSERKLEWQVEAFSTSYAIIQRSTRLSWQTLLRFVIIHLDFSRIMYTLDHLKYYDPYDVIILFSPDKL